MVVRIVRCPALATSPDERHTKLTQSNGVYTCECGVTFAWEDDRWKIIEPVETMAQVADH